MSTTTESYAQKYATKAEEVFKNEDIDTAIGNMNVAVELQPSNWDYAAKLENYKLYIPFPLYIEDNIFSVDSNYRAKITKDNIVTANDGSILENNIGF